MNIHLPPTHAPSEVKNHNFESENPIASPERSRREHGNEKRNTAQREEVKIPIMKRACGEHIGTEKSDSQKLYKHKKISRCLDQIRDNFPLKERDNLESGFYIDIPEILKSTRHHWFSNEFPINPDSELDFCKVINALDSIPDDGKDCNAVSVAIVVGESSLLSILPNLSRVCDVVLICDYDPLLLHSMMYSIELIKTCDEVSNKTYFYETLKTLSIKCEDKYIAKIDIEQWEQTEEHRDDYTTQCLFDRGFSHEKLKFSVSRDRSILGLGAYHCFSSECRFKETLKAVNEIQCIPVPINLHDKKPIEKLCQILHTNDCKVKFLNLSNFPEYNYEAYHMGCTKPLAASTLSQLPFSDNVLIADSLLANEEKARTRIFYTPQSYWKALGKFQPFLSAPRTD